jgi:hypothetical protein
MTKDMKGSPENSACFRRWSVVYDGRPYGRPKVRHGRLAFLKGRRDASRQGAHDEGGPTLAAARIRLKKIFRSGAACAIFQAAQPCRGAIEQLFRDIHEKSQYVEVLTNLSSIS